MARADILQAGRTATDFKAELPEFEDVPNAEVTRFLKLAQEIHYRSDRAVMYCAAHIMTVDSDNDLTVTDTGVIDSNISVTDAQIQSVTLGPKTISYFDQNAQNNRSSSSGRSAADQLKLTYFNQTNYGKLYLILESKASAVRPFRVF